MKLYGLKIGSIGLEFPSRDDRNKAMVTFASSQASKIQEYAGPRYSPADKSFGTYEREEGQQLINCSKCSGVFTPETCGERTVPSRTNFPSGFDAEKMQDAWLCDGCYAQWMQDKKVWDAKQTIAASE